MTACNACGAYIDEWRFRTAFLCPRCVDKCPIPLMEAYEKACSEFEVFRQEEFKRAKMGIAPRPRKRSILIGKVSEAWSAARAAVKQSVNREMEPA